MVYKKMDKNIFKTKKEKLRVLSEVYNLYNK